MYWVRCQGAFLYSRILNVDERNSLRSVFISDNQLSEIAAPSSSDSPLQSVNTLFLDGNSLKHWSSIDAMVEWLPNINNLRAADTPLTTGELALFI
jgi:hypothetical protein